MPAESEAQRKWAFGVKGPGWAEKHHFDNPGKLPKKVKGQDEEVMSEDAKKPYGDVEYADTGYQSDGKHRYPIDTEEHARAAWSYINKAHNAAQYSSEDLAKVKSRIKRACKKFGIDIGEEEKAGEYGEGEEENGDKMKMSQGYIECRAAVEIPLAASRNELTFLPAGLHEIMPVGGGIGKPIKVLIDSHAADEIESQRRAIQARSGKRPYFDFNHEDGAASFWPNEFSWKKGEGVVCKGEWSRSGKDAVEGKDFRAFSPVFYVDDKRGDPAKVVCREQAKPNMGGLVNDPAFSNLPLWAKNAGAASESKNNNNTGENKTMTKEENAALQNRIADLETTVADLSAVVAGDSGNELASAKLEAAEATLRAEKTRYENEKIKERADAQANALSARAKADADAAVADAVRRGAIKAKDVTRQQWWREQCIADSNNISVLKGMPGQEHLFGPLVNRGNGVGNGSREIAITSEEPRAVVRKLVTLQRNQLMGRVAVADKLQIAREFGAIYAAEFGLYSPSGGKKFFSMRPREMDDALYAGDNTDSNLGTLSGTLVTQRTLELLKLVFPSITAFTTDFSDQPAQFNQTIMTRTITIPGVSDYNTSTGWTDSTAATGDVPVTINKHRGVPITFNSNILESTVRRLFDEFAPAQAYALAKDMVDNLYSNITDANFTNNTVCTSANMLRSVVVDIGTALTKRGVPLGMKQRTLLLWPDAFGSLVKDSAIIQPLAYLGKNLVEMGTTEQSEFIVPVDTFSVINAPNLPSNNANLIGFGGSKSALVIASRVPNDYTAVLPGASYGNVAMVTDPDLGLTVLQVQYVNHTLGTATSRISLMYGTAAGQGGAGQLVKANSGSGSSH